MIKQQGVRNHDQDTERYEIVVRMFMPTKREHNILQVQSYSINMMYSIMHVHSTHVHMHLHYCIRTQLLHACTQYHSKATYVHSLSSKVELAASERGELTASGNSLSLNPEVLGDDVPLSERLKYLSLRL